MGSDLQKIDFAVCGSVSHKQWECISLIYTENVGGGKNFRYLKERR